MRINTLPLTKLTRLASAFTFTMAATTCSHTTVVGNPPNFWLFSKKDGFDLTHPATPVSPLVYPRLNMHTTNTPITISPPKTALVIIDMQNFFLSLAVGRKRGEGHEAEDVLLQYGIPAARKAGIRIIWLTWGITDEDLKTMPPTVFRIFGFEGDDPSPDEENEGITLKRPEKKSDGGLGSPLGHVKLENDTIVDAGRMLMRDQWNTALHSGLQAAFEEGLHAKVPDVRFHKNRLSGLWEPHGELDDFLVENGIRTLLFTGVNSDQCVLATIQDASFKWYDTVLLKDGCGTNSPAYTRQMVEFNCEKSWGFVSSCKELAKGVEERFDQGQKKDEIWYLNLRN